MPDVIIMPFEQRKICETAPSPQVNLRKRFLGCASFDRFTWLPMIFLNDDYSAEKRSQAARALTSLNLSIAGRNLGGDGSGPESSALAPRYGDDA